MTYQLAQEAIDKLNAIIASTKVHSGHQAAQAKHRAFEKEFERIARLPRIGTPRPRLGNSMRSISLKPYIIVWGIKENDDVVITDILTASEASRLFQ